MLFREIEAANLRRRDRIEDFTVQAYQTVKIWAITKSKKGRMPRFETLLPREREKAQSTAEMRAAVELISGQYGNRVRKITRTST